MYDLSNVSVGIRTFLRDEALKDAISGIQETMPEVEIVIADDGRPSAEKDCLYYDLNDSGDHFASYYPFDSGFGFKSNRIVENFSEKYLLIGSDDFDFRPASVRYGIEKLTWTLDNYPDLDIVSGRVNDWPYEFYLHYNEDGTEVKEVPANNFCYDLTKLPYLPVDLTVNYNLIRRKVFDKVSWDEVIKIGGGEHFGFYADCKEHGYKVAWVPGVSIKQQPRRDPDEYRVYRARANDPARPAFDSRGIRKYTLGDGRIDYERKN
jgi:hypothetical protein